MKNKHKLEVSLAAINIMEVYTNYKRSYQKFFKYSTHTIDYYWFVILPYSFYPTGRLISNNLSIQPKVYLNLDFIHYYQVKSKISLYITYYYYSIKHFFKND